MVIDETKEGGETWPAHEGPVEEFGLFPGNTETLNSGMI